MREQRTAAISRDLVAEDRAAASPNVGRESLTAFLRYFLYLGTVGFGGPIALVGYMQRDLVDDRRWISAEDYKEGLAPAPLAPGCLAAEPSVYLGLDRST